MATITIQISQATKNIITSLINKEMEELKAVWQEPDKKIIITAAKELGIYKIPPNNQKTIK